ncbi:MAG: hypothetical protein RQ966_03695 [Acetobacteraceae bacterium]|nr:hypothetical protein [Acetobacteraceae bacterium]
MSRPFTLVCMVCAFGAGLYLYQSKHQAQMLDREIARTMKLTETTRERTGMLRAEWALLNEPDRLAELAKAHTTLQTLKPTQFVAVNDLATRLPAPVASKPESLPAEAEPDSAPAVPVAQASPPAAVTPAPAPKPHDVAAADAKPKPETKAEPKPSAVAEAKPVRRVERPAVAKAEPAPVVATAELAPIRARSPRWEPEPGSSEATAPGTVGAAVLRAMRAQNGGSAVPVHPYNNPAPAYAQPVATAPSYAPGPMRPAYAGPSAAGPAASVLGGSGLPPPVPFAAR